MERLKTSVDAVFENIAARRDNRYAIKQKKQKGKDNEEKEREKEKETKREETTKRGSAFGDFIQ